MRRVIATTLKEIRWTSRVYFRCTPSCSERCQSALAAYLALVTAAKSPGDHRPTCRVAANFRWRICFCQRECEKWKVVT
eukprot:4489157-Prymnesium_polylepis.1